MAATCEISNVFSNYFSTMYSSDDPTLASVPPAPTFGADDLVLALGSPQMALEGTGGSQEGLGIWGESLGQGRIRQGAGWGRIDWFDLLVVQRTLEYSPTPQFKSISSSVLSFLPS